MKAFFSKVWAWIVANKIVSIVIAGVLVVGVTLSIVLPILLNHDHEFGSELKSNETTHYYVCECGEKKDETAHEFGSELKSNETTHYYVCECGVKKDETAHEYDKEVANETYFVSETDTAFVYNKSCECGAKGTDTFEVSKTVATISNIGSSYVYSGTGVEITFETNSDGEATYTYFEQGSDTALDGAPKNAGNYSVIISIAGNDTYTPVVSEKVDFEITKKVLTGTFSQNAFYGQTTGSGNSTRYRFVLGTEYGVVEGDEVYLLVYYRGNTVNSESHLYTAQKEVSDGLYSTDENYDKSGLTVTSTIVFDLDNTIVIDCRTEYSDTINVTAGQVIYFKINGAGGTLCDFWFKATTGSTATFTYEVFRATDTTTPIDSTTTAGKEIFVDIYDTIDQYLVVTCVTDGEVRVTAD